MARGLWGGSERCGTALRLTLALAGLGAVLFAATYATDRGAAPATAWLGLSAAAVLAPLLLLVERERLPLALLSLLAPAAIVLLPRQGALPIAALALLLAAAVALTAFDLGRRAAQIGRFAWLALAFAAQTLLHFDRLWSRPFEPATLFDLVAAPALAAILLSTLEATPGGDPLWAAAALFAAGPGATPASLAALALAVLLVRLRPAVAPLAPAVVALSAFGHEPAWAALALCGFAAACALGSTTLARTGRGLIGFVALGSLLAAAPPWLRDQPVAALLSALAQPPFARVDRPHSHQSLALSAASPTAGWPLSGAPVGRLVVDSFLTEAAALGCGRKVATVRLSAAGRAPVVAAIGVGDGAGEWASARPDVAGALACPTLTPFTHWLPASGRFFGRSFRARIVVDPPYPAERVEIERAADLPDAVRIHLEGVASER